MITYITKLTNDACDNDLRARIAILIFATAISYYSLKVKMKIMTLK